MFFALFFTRKTPKESARVRADISPQSSAEAGAAASQAVKAEGISIAGPRSNIFANLARRALVPHARNVTTWFVLALMGLAVRTAMSPRPPSHLGNAAAEPPTVSAAVDGAGVPSDNTCAAVSDGAAVPEGPVSGEGAASVDQDETGRILAPDALTAGDSSGEAAVPGSSSRNRAAQNRPCKRDLTLRAFFTNYCRVGAGDLGVCCANDDGFCSSYLGSRCGSYDDNDCRIFDVLMKAHEFLLAGKGFGQYTPDPRESAFGSKGEYFRLVPCMQAQGYLNLYSCTGDESFLEEALDRLDFIASHLDEALTRTPYDGELGWAFLDAYRVTCDERYLDIGLKIADSSEPNASHVLNWGLLEAMSLLKAHEVTGDQSTLTEAATIVTETLDYQNSDGSFPHQAHFGARNLPYTAWLVRDLIKFAEHGEVPAGLANAVDRAGTLLEHQLSANGSPRYEGDSLVVKRIPDPMCVRCAKLGSAGCADYCSDICPGEPELLPCSCITDPERDCPYVDVLVNITYYDDGASDYDVRGWTSELPATAAVLDRTGRLEAKWKVLDFLFTLQNPDGSFPDKWGYMPKPEDRMFELASSKNSVIRTSAVFYYLSGMLRRPDVVWPEQHNITADGSSVNGGSPRLSGEGGRPSGNALSGDAVPHDAAPNDAVPGSDDASSAGGESTYDSARPSDTALQHAAPQVFVRPNPSFGAISIDYDAEATPCLVQILDVSGRLITELAPCADPDGNVQWNGVDSDGRKVPPGVYFVKVTAGEETTCTKVILLGPDGVS